MASTKLQLSVDGRTGRGLQPSLRGFVRQSLQEGVLLVCCANAARGEVAQMRAHRMPTPATPRPLIAGAVGHQRCHHQSRAPTARQSAGLSCFVWSSGVSSAVGRPEWGVGGGGGGGLGGGGGAMDRVHGGDSQVLGDGGRGQRGSQTLRLQHRALAAAGLADLCLARAGVAARGGPCATRHSSDYTDSCTR
eukprot:SAG31_NODE_364_length_16841_cov_7.005256_2_plen_192_part_00